MLRSKFTEIHHGQTGALLYKAVWVWCPGCDELHQFVVERCEDQSVPVWNWDGNTENPTFNPSCLVTWDGLGADGNPEHRVCHSFLHEGVWDFLSDSTHALAGQKVHMVDLPYWLTKA